VLRLALPCSRQPGSRIEIIGGGESRALEEIISTINRLGMEITTVHIEQLPEAAKRDLCVHVNNEDASRLMAELQSKGYQVSLRQR